MYISAKADYPLRALTLVVEDGPLTAADVMRAIEGPLAEVRGLRPEATGYEGATVHLRDLWVAVRASLRGVRERVTLADLAARRFPAPVRRLLADEDAWRSL